MAPKTIAVSLLILISAYGIDTRAADMITGGEIDVSLRNEYNRGFGYCWDLSAAGGVGLRDMFALRGGLSVGSLSNVTADIKAFSSAGVDPFSNMPLRFSLSYIYNGLPRYGVHTQSVIPAVSYRVSRVAMSYGPCFRFASFFGEPAQYELINSFSASVDIISNGKRRLDAIVGNFSDFCAKNMGAYSLKLNYAEFIAGNWAVVNEAEFLQSGSDALTADFYGLVWRGGARYSW